MYLLNIKEGSGGLREVGQMVIQSTLIVDATDFAEAKEIVREWVDSNGRKYTTQSALTGVCSLLATSSGSGV